MEHYEYMKIPLHWFPQEIINQYKIMDLLDKYSFVYVKIRKGMYSINQEACIAFYHLVKQLKPHGYYPLRSNPGIWCHGMLPTKLALCVESFGIKCKNPAHDHHLVDTPKQTAQYPMIGEGGITVALI